MTIRRTTLIAAAFTLVFAGASALAMPAMAATTDDTQIADVQQAVGLPASGTCAAIDDAALNWSGVASGGWSQGWGSWLNNGAGGVSCNRTLTFSPSTGTWSVAS